MLEGEEKNLLQEINMTNASAEYEYKFEETNDTLKRLASNYPYYGKYIVSSTKDINKKSFLRITMRTYLETKDYPDNGNNIQETINIFGSIRKSISYQVTYTNNHILIKNKNKMTNELITFLDQLIKSVNNINDKLDINIDSVFIIINIINKLFSFDSLLDEYYIYFKESINYLEQTILKTI